MAFPVIVRTVSGITAPIYGGYLLIFYFHMGNYPNANSGND